jgi:hypothetical protein
LKTKKIVFFLTCAFIFACASSQRPQTPFDGITFETGKSRKMVMQAIMEVIHIEGFKVAYINEQNGMIGCKPRMMLNGVLQEKIKGTQWNMQTFASTLNHRIEFSAKVNPDGVVKLKALVMETSAPGSVDGNTSEKLTRYYENRIKEVLRKWTAMSK